jgi:hypothetical protein
MVRSWEVEIKPDPGLSSEFGSEQSNDELKAMMSQKFQQLEDRFLALTEMLTQPNNITQNDQIASTSRGRGRGRPIERRSPLNRGSRGSTSSNRSRGSRGSRGSRRSRNVTGSHVSTVSQAARQRLNDFINQATDASQAQIDNNLTTKKTIYIKKIDCQINSTSIDQVDDKNDEDQTMQQYFT